jgi:predicted lipoprotein
MPLIRIEFDDVKVSDSEALAASKAIRDIVSEETNIQDVFVYANTAKIKIQIAPIEVFIEMSDHKIDDVDILFDKFKNKISFWKKAVAFPHPINLTLIPMRWKVETGI